MLNDEKPYNWCDIVPHLSAIPMVGNFTSAFSRPRKMCNVVGEGGCMIPAVCMHMQDSLSSCVVCF